MSVFSRINKSNDLPARIASGSALFCVCVVAILYSPVLFHIIIALVLCGMLSEWYDITKTSNVFLAIGIVTLPIAITSITLVYSMPAGHIVVFIYFALVVVTDTFAMVGGRLIRGPKLASKISPNKTWSGLISGALASATCAYPMHILLNQYVVGFTFEKFALYAAIFAVVEQYSDLFVSIVKRTFGVKDSGSIIPGHGGILDRCDGMILTAPILLWMWA